MHKSRRGNSFLAVQVHVSVGVMLSCAWAATQGCSHGLGKGRAGNGWISSPCSAQVGGNEEYKPSSLVHGEIHSILPGSYCSMKQRREKENRLVVEALFTNQVK